MYFLRAKKDKIGKKTQVLKTGSLNGELNCVQLGVSELNEEKSQKKKPNKENATQSRRHVTKGQSAGGENTD